MIEEKGIRKWTGKVKKFTKSLKTQPSTRYSDMVMDCKKKYDTTSNEFTECMRKARAFLAKDIKD